MTAIYIIISITLSIVIYGVFEYRIHQKRVLSIPIRIHVNGTRGKSSVSRLIGAGLRSGGYNAVTKVTGTYPRLIPADGSEIRIRRKEKANILEQLSIINYCRKIKADAIVIECMALQPKYQYITENQMIHATIGVITNIRLDHLDVMGPSITDVADALSNTIPKGKVLFTSEDKHKNYLDHICQKKNTRLHIAQAASITDEEMKGFKYIEHKENVALALDVCQHLGIDRSAALNEMKKTTPDAGVLVRNTIQEDNKIIRFYNAFAANDPESSLMIWNTITIDIDEDEHRIVLLTIRHDRQSRALQLISLAAEKMEFDYIVLIGETTDIVEEKAVKIGIPKKKIINRNWDTPEKVYEGLIELSFPKTTIVGIGNMGAMGAEVSQIFKSKQINYD
jgi:poly-gamma-glutamate synthase PgsB/CapB